MKVDGAGQQLHRVPDRRRLPGRAARAATRRPTPTSQAIFDQVYANGGSTPHAGHRRLGHLQRVRLQQHRSGERGVRDPGDPAARDERRRGCGQPAAVHGAGIERGQRRLAVSHGSRSRRRSTRRSPMPIAASRPACWRTSPCRSPCRTRSVNDTTVYGGVTVARRAADFWTTRYIATVNPFTSGPTINAYITSPSQFQSAFPGAAVSITGVRRRGMRRGTRCRRCS